jgi:hypothetical protein
MIKILLTSYFLFVIIQVHAKSEFVRDFDLDLLGKGARAAGMAYAFNAVADDATALSWNPAGIVQIKNPELAFSNSLKNTEYRHALYEYDYRPVYTIDFFGFVYPLKLKKKDLVFGVSYQNKWNFKFNYENLPSEYSIQYGEKTLTVNSVSVCGAYSLNRFIGVGIAYNRWFSLGNKSETYALYYEKKLYPQEPENFPDESVFTKSDSYKYSGNNLTIGILFDFSCCHLPLRYTLKYDSKMNLKDDNNYIGRSDYNREYGEDTSWLNTIHLIDIFEYPSVLTNGLAFRIGDFTTVACDFDLQFFKNRLWIRDFSQTISCITDNQNIISKKDSVGHFESPLFYERMVFNQFRIGLEYILHPEFGYFPIRIGYKINTEEIQTYNANHEAVKRVEPFSINVGTGLTLRHFSIDFAYEAYWWQRIDENLQKEKKTDHFFVLSAIWYFK